MRHYKCKLCGYIRLYTAHMAKCPVCGNKDESTLVPSGTPKEEALKLLCNAFKPTMGAESQKDVKQALDIIMKNSI